MILSSFLSFIVRLLSPNFMNKLAGICVDECHNGEVVRVGAVA